MPARQITLLGCDIILEPKEMIQKLKNKGVIFAKCNEEDAMTFLCERNYYVKLTAYKTNFSKHHNQYVGLDFKALQDLSTIDMYLKQSILKMSLSVEHALKVNLLNDMQDRAIDDFRIVKDYLQSYPRILNEIESRRETSYVKDLLKKFTHPVYPVWVLLEVIPFGEFVNFYRFYCDKYNYISLEHSILYGVRNIRNAAAHNNCIIHNLADKTGYFDRNLVKRVSKLIPHTKVKTIQDRLKNQSVKDFVSLLIAMNLVLKSPDLKTYALKELIQLYETRMLRDSDLYESAPAVNQMYTFCKGIIDSFNN